MKLLHLNILRYSLSKEEREGLDPLFDQFFLNHVSLSALTKWGIYFHEEVSTGNLDPLSASLFHLRALSIDRDQEIYGKTCGIFKEIDDPVSKINETVCQRIVPQN